MMESGFYPPGAEHDRNAPWNETDDDQDAREDAYRRMTETIGKITGKDLYEANGDDVDAMMDTYDLPVFDKYDQERDWEELPPAEKAMWNAYAEIHAYFGHQLINEDMVEAARQEGDL